MDRGSGSVGSVCRVFTGQVVFFFLITDTASVSLPGQEGTSEMSFGFLFTSLPTVTKGGSSEHLYHLFYLKQRLAPFKGTWILFPIISTPSM